MSALIIYGASDDLIEVEGIIRDELGAPYDKPGIVTVKVDDAVWTQFRIEYTDDGIWRIENSTPSVPGTIIPARSDRDDDDLPDDEHGCPGYSDKIVLRMDGIEGRRINVSVEAGDPQ